MEEATSGIAIVIGNYNLQYYPSEVWDTADFLRIGD